MLFKIGEFSKISNISVKTLRYYDEIDLFKPIDIDINTQYRFYSIDQVKDLQVIKELQDLGFTLNEIKINWNKFTAEVLLNKRAEIMNDIAHQQENIKKIDHMRSILSNGKFINQTNDRNEEILLRQKTLFVKEKK